MLQGRYWSYDLYAKEHQELLPRDQGMDYSSALLEGTNPADTSALWN